jgi:hypothetical protein
MHSEKDPVGVLELRSTTASDRIRALLPTPDRAYFDHLPLLAAA